MGSDEAVEAKGSGGEQWKPFGVYVETLQPYRGECRVCGGLEDGVGLRASMIGRAVARRSGDASSVRVPYHINAMTEGRVSGAACEGYIERRRRRRRPGGGRLLLLLLPSSSTGSRHGRGLRRNERNARREGSDYGESRVEARGDWGGAERRQQKERAGCWRRASEQVYIRTWRGGADGGRGQDWAGVGLL